MARDPLFVLIAVRHAPPGAILPRLSMPAQVSASMTAAGDLMPTVITPDAIRQRILAIDGQIDALDKEISRSKDTKFVEAWADFWKRWKAWKDKTYPDYWLLFWSGKAVDEELTQWQTELGKWREEAKKRGVELVSPAPPGPPPSTQPTVIGPALDGITTAVTVVALAGLGIVAIRAFKG